MHIKITDFGTAKIFSGDEANNKGEKGVCLYTNGSMLWSSFPSLNRSIPLLW